MNAIKGDSHEDARQIGVIGYGPVGEATVKQLGQKATRAKIDVVEVNDDKIHQVNRLNRRFRGIQELDTKKQYELVFGCTGYDSFRLGQRNLLADKAQLVSGSSAAVEFNRAGFIELADRYSDDDLKVLPKIERGIKGFMQP